MNRRSHVWIIDDDQPIRWVLERALQRAKLEVSCFPSADDALVALESHAPDAIVSDIRMPGTDGLTFLKRLHEDHPGLPIIIMTAHSDLDSAVTAYEGGAFEYLPKPFDVDEAVQLVRRACAVAQESASEMDSPKPSGPTSDIIGAAPVMQEVFRAIGRLSRSSTTVLISGESGTGKELIARALHRHSPRVNAPFIALNTAAIPRDLLESELFGHEKGAFTGAQGQRKGRFEQADGGTLFLDEIGDMPPELQTRLLRVLADGEFYPIGGYEAVKVDVRIIAATHQNLDDLVQAHRFREDLFHRLNVIRVHAPALRERREDIPLLLNHFLKTSAAELGEEPKKPLPEVEEFLSQMDWPGNVRQLENVSRWITVMASGRDIHLEDLPAELRQDGRPDSSVPWEQALRHWADDALRNGESRLLSSALPSFERILIDTALGRTGGRRQDAAKLLGWGRNTLTRKIKELGISG
jgi:two-component system nitrogen regulation response regulator GlnG